MERPRPDGGADIQFLFRNEVRSAACNFLLMPRSRVQEQDSIPVTADR